MAKVTFPSVLHGVEGWDAELEEWKNIFTNFPLPLFRPASGLFADLPAANLNDDGLAVVNDPTAGVILVLSNGTTYRKIGVQAAVQANSVAATVGALVTDFNALLAKLKTAGLMAGP